jgi:hypothetical protein
MSQTEPEPVPFAYLDTIRGEINGHTPEGQEALAAVDLLDQELHTARDERVAVQEILATQASAPEPGG